MQLDARETRGEIHAATQASLPPADREPRTTNMMAFDRTPTPPDHTLEPDTVDALRATFATGIQLGRHDPELGLVLQRAAREARDKQIPPERLLVALKTIWNSILATNAPPPATDETLLLQALVSRCIQEYYAL